MAKKEATTSRLQRAEEMAEDHSYEGIEEFDEALFEGLDSTSD